MLDLHTYQSLARTRMAEDAERAARRRLRRHVGGSSLARTARSLAAFADRRVPSRHARDAGYEVERAA